MQDGAAPPQGAVARIAQGFALLGGLSLLFVAALTTVSVVSRWQTSQPVRGDVEMISLGSGLAVMFCLAYGTLMRTNLLVDSFTNRLPARVNHIIDAFWNLIWAITALFLARGMAIGASEALANRTTTIGLLGVPIWWAIAIGALCLVVTAAAGFYWSWRFLRGRA